MSKKRPSQKLNYDDLCAGDILLYIPCPILTRIIKIIGKRTINFHDGSTCSRSTLNKWLLEDKLEITRNSRLIYPE